MGAGLFAHRSLVLPSSQQDGNTIKPPFPSAAFGPDARRFLQAGEGAVAWFGAFTTWGQETEGKQPAGLEPRAGCAYGTDTDTA